MSENTKNLEMDSVIIAHQSAYNEQRSIADDIIKAWSDQSAVPVVSVPVTKAERIKSVQQELVIAHPTYAAAMNHAMCMVKQERRPRAPGLIVTGPVASGKTTFGRTILWKFQQLPPTSAIQNLPPCAVMISLTGLTTAHGFYGRILRALNAPVKTRQVRSEREDVAITALAQANCSLLVLDELQDILKGSIQDQHRVLDTIKYIMNTLGMPVLGLGIEEAGRALEGNPHLKARFTEVRLSKWGYDQNYFSLLASVEPHLHLGGGAKLTESAIAKRILELSEGNMGLIMEIIRNAAVVAIATGTDKITVDMIKPLSELPDHHFYDVMKEARHEPIRA
jgi:hypothetical protein